ncbi:MAG: PstS family phosphate ABC transporter substrate-binding protein [Natrialbaceae archaeon]|nr:PstS family phosphate ABC transporter substrate-binding protein [Natrialbaceae archaeon]
MAFGGRSPVTRRRALLALSSGSMLGVSGCLIRGQDSGLRGEIVIDGSDTLYPVTTAIVEQFLWENNRVRIPVRGSGTGAGFERFCFGETDLQDASRQITSSERENCRANGIEYIELTVALDGIVVMKHLENDWCECLTRSQLGAIWERNSSITTWADINGDWPAEEISFYGRELGIGDLRLLHREADRGSGNIRRDYSATPNTNVIIRGVRGNRYSIGFGGAGYYFENEADLDVIAVDDGNGCVVPTKETIESGQYTPLSRPLYLYVRTDRLKDEAIRSFLRFYLDHAQEAAPLIGYYAISDDTLSESRSTLEAAIEAHA